MYCKLMKILECKIEILWNKITILPVSRRNKSYARELDYIKSQLVSLCK